MPSISIPVGIGAAEVGADVGLGAALTLPEVAVTAAAPELGVGLGAGLAEAATAAAPLAAGGAGAALASGALDAAPAAAAGLPSALPTSALPGASAPPPVTGAPTSAPPPSGPIGGGSAGTPAAPASVTQGTPISNVLSGVDSPTGTQLASAGGSDGVSDTGTQVAATGNASSGAPYGPQGQLPAGAEGNVPGAAAAPSTDSNSFMGALKSAGSTLKGIGKDLEPFAPLAALAPVASLLFQPKIPGSSQIGTAAQQLTQQGQQLQNYLQTGSLPPGVQQGIDQATKSAEASIRSKYAQMGDSGSSAEAQDLANANQVASAQGAQIAIQLLNSGVAESALGTQLYQYIMQNSLSQDQQLGTALSTFAASLVPKTVTIQQATP